MATQLRAEDEARELVETAENQARELVETAERTAAEQRQRVGELQQLDADHRQRLGAHLEEQLAALEALPDPFAALASELSPPPAPQTSDDGADEVVEEAAVTTGDAGRQPFTDGAHSDATPEWGAGDAQHAEGEGGGDDGSHEPGSAEGPDPDAVDAASIEEEVADLWRLKDDSGPAGEVPTGDDTPDAAWATGEDAAPAGDEPAREEH